MTGIKENLISHSMMIKKNLCAFETVRIREYFMHPILKDRRQFICMLEVVVTSEDNSNKKGVL